MVAKIKIAKLLIIKDLFVKKGNYSGNYPFFRIFSEGIMVRRLQNAKMPFWGHFDKYTEAIN